MAQFQKDKIWKRFLYSKFSIITLAVLTLFFAYNVTDIIKKSVETNKNLDGALHELDTLKSEKDRLGAGIDTLNSSKGAEDTIREKYRVVKDGEGLVVIVDDHAKASEMANASEAVKNEHGFWNFFKRIFAKQNKN